MSPLGDLLFVQINMKQILDKLLKLGKVSDSFCQSTWLLNTIFDLALVLDPRLGKFCSLIYISLQILTVPTGTPSNIKKNNQISIINK